MEWFLVVLMFRLTSIFEAVPSRIEVTDRRAFVPEEKKLDTPKYLVVTFTVENGKAERLSAYVSDLAFRSLAHPIGGGELLRLEVARNGKVLAKADVPSQVLNAQEGVGPVWVDRREAVEVLPLTVPPDALNISFGKSHFEPLNLKPVVDKFCSLEPSSTWCKKKK